MVTHIYFVYEFLGNEEHEIKPYKDCLIIEVEKIHVKDGIISQSVYKQMLNSAIMNISIDNNLDYPCVQYEDVIITFWSEINYG